MPKRTVFAAFAAFYCVFLSACATTDLYKSAPEGRFDGVLLVMWVDEGPSGSGDGKFVFVPDPANPLTFTRSNTALPGAIVQPGTMYTDGGSIPKIAQLFTGLSPWGYAPAYMIHDWLFTAHHCIADGSSDPIYETVRDVDFNQSGTILIEAIRTLVAENKVKKNDVAVSLVNTGVRSGTAKRYWNEQGACARDAVSDEHLEAISRLLSPNSRRIFQQNNDLPAFVPPGGGAAQLITRIEF